MFAAYTQDAEVTRYVVWRPHADVSTTEAFITRCLGGWNEGSEYTYAAMLLGMISLRVSGWSASLGYVLARHAWGQGIMTEAANALTTYVLEQPTMFRV